jgi:hypothetical protein
LSEQKATNLIERQYMNKVGKFFVVVASIASILFGSTVASADPPRVGAGVRVFTPNNNIPWITQTSNSLHGPLHRGDSVTWQILAKNAGNITSDYETHVDGAYSNATTQFMWTGSPNEVTDWTTFSPKVRDALAPAETYLIAVNITVPTDAALGTHLAVAWTCVRVVQSGGQVRMGACAGIRMYLEVV